MAYIPNRGDVVWLEFKPRAGSGQAGRRAALVISPLSYNKKVGLAVFCLITPEIKGYPFEVIVPSGSKLSGAILSDRIMTLDWKSRKASRIFTLDDAVIEAVLRRLKALLQV